MKTEGCRGVSWGVVAFVSLLAVTLGWVVPDAHAAKNDCLVTFRGVTDANTQGGTFACTDCDPSCDTDGVNTPNKSCQFSFQVVINRPATGCTATDIKKVKVKKAGKCKLSGTKITPNGTASVQGAFTGVVRTKKNGKKAGSCKIIAMAKGGRKPRQVDSDKLTLTCNPQGGTCPTVTTTTTTSTTLPPGCGNGVKEGLEECDDANTNNNDTCTNTCQSAACGDTFLQPGEQCDPPCGTGCGAGQICNNTCQCVAAAACACGSPDPTRLSFTTTAPLQGNSGMILDGSNANILDLKSGGLYFGGGAVGVPLPAAVPDLGNSLTKTCCNGSAVTLVATTLADTSSNRTCTSKDCLFGPPLPIPNYANTAISTCVINKVAKNGVGRLQCDTGLSELNLPLTSEVFLTADLLNGTTSDRPDVPGTQPCPICSRVCAGGTNAGLPCAADGECPSSTCAASPTCLGGPNHNQACTPGTSALPGAGTDPNDTPYPTSHDCPPPGTPVGTLPIGFALTTETATKPGVASGSQARVFCGFCRDTDGTFYFEGDPNGLGGALHPCASNADCTQPWESCEQNNTGAFHQGNAAMIVENGVRAAGITDHTSTHVSRLVSVFCIPPTFNAAIDATADLPGPGAVSLPGVAQLLP
jgi:cysteine-rich repeat protein